MNKIFCFLTTLLVSCLLNAHGDHDHGPGNITPPKGGIIRSLETINLELLQLGKVIKIYVYDKELNPKKTEDYPASAMVNLPRKKPVAIKLEAKGDHWEFSYDAKGSHRYTLQLKIEQGGHKDNLKWNLEPKN